MDKFLKEHKTEFEQSQLEFYNFIKCLKLSKCELPSVFQDQSDVFKRWKIDYQIYSMFKYKDNFLSWYENLKSEKIFELFTEHKVLLEKDYWIKKIKIPKNELISRPLTIYSNKAAFHIYSILNTINKVFMDKIESSSEICENLKMIAKENAFSGFNINQDNVSLDYFEEYLNYYNKVSNARDTFSSDRFTYLSTDFKDCFPSVSKDLIHDFLEFTGLDKLEIYFINEMIEFWNIGTSGLPQMDGLTLFHEFFKSLHLFVWIKFSEKFKQEWNAIKFLAFYVDDTNIVIDNKNKIYDIFKVKLRDHLESYGLKWNESKFNSDLTVYDSQGNSNIVNVNHFLLYLFTFIDSSDNFIKLIRSYETKWNPHNHIYEINEIFEILLYEINENHDKIEDIEKLNDKINNKLNNIELLISENFLSLSDLNQEWQGTKILINNCQTLNLNKKTLLEVYLLLIRGTAISAYPKSKTEQSHNDFFKNYLAIIKDSKNIAKHPKLFKHINHIFSIDIIKEILKIFQEYKADRYVTSFTINYILLHLYITLYTSDEKYSKEVDELTEEMIFSEYDSILLKSIQKNASTHNINIKSVLNNFIIFSNSLKKYNLTTSIFFNNIIETISKKHSDNELNSKDSPWSTTSSFLKKPGYDYRRHYKLRNIVAHGFRLPNEKDQKTYFGSNNFNTWEWNNLDKDNNSIYVLSPKQKEKEQIYKKLFEELFK